MGLLNESVSEIEFVPDFDLSAQPENSLRWNLEQH
jgi:hypothetical protein